MDIGVLIGIVVSIVVGVAIIPVVSETMKTLDTSNMSSAMISLINIIPIIVVTMIIIGSVGYFVNMRGVGEDDQTDVVAFTKTQELKQKLYKIENDVAKIESIQMESNVVENKDIIKITVEDKTLSPKIGGAIKSFRR